jgi:uncharacterized YigZ family protein
MQAYFVPAAPVTEMTEIKKSRFITLLAPTRGIESAKAFIRQAREQYASATHHCWAYIAGPPWDLAQCGSSDDGEPSGTAGRPMLAQLQGAGIGEITAVAVRYFGGIKLGTGGLVRAYGGGVRQALTLLTRVEIVPQVEFVVFCRYEQQSWVESLLKHVAGQIIQSDYGESVKIRLAIPYDKVTEAGQKLSDISRGALQLMTIT